MSIFFVKTFHRENYNMYVDALSLI